MVEIDSNNQNLYSHLEGLLCSNLYRNDSINSCPHCNGKKFIKYGNYRNGQRYLCKICSKTFCNRTNTPFYHSKKPILLWYKYIEKMLSKSTLRESSKELKLSLRTSFYWRHKILNSLVKYKETEILIKSIDMIKIFTKENYKGDRNAPFSIRDKVWNILASDVKESILARPISIGGWNKKNFNHLIYSKIHMDSNLHTYSDRYLHFIANNHNKTRKIDKMNFNSTFLSTYLVNIRDVLCRSRGVATKYLTHYLYFSSLYSSSKKYTSLSLLYTLRNLSTYIKNHTIKLIPPISI